MEVEVKQTIENCDSCPFGTAEKVYTADSWDNCRKVFCKKLGVDVHHFLDWHETAEIPKICPFHIKEKSKK